MKTLWINYVNVNSLNHNHNSYILSSFRSATMQNVFNVLLLLLYSIIQGTCKTFIKVRHIDKFQIISFQKLRFIVNNSIFFVL